VVLRVPGNFIFYLSAHERCTEKLLFRAKARDAEELDASPDPDAILIRRMVGTVLREINRMKGLVRLKQLGPHILYGYLKPRHRIGAHVCDQLAKRSDNTIIILGNSRESWVSLCRNGRIMRCSGKGLCRTLEDISSGLSIHEDEAGASDNIEKIWRVYYSSQCRPEQRNMPAFHRHIPKMALDSAGLEAERNKNGVTLERFFDI
jgi:hypothetical protein